ncbi:KH domain-containing protein akap-1 [Diachasma alloeum]|uniref:KH domain-containing protein akap-1 n=1 Tax=Diachasma alloeum TaxID=454923 RepID=UPI0007382439|nr:KH domain-containing protein akap-1 [Diachasma alloeum]XP_015113343.1 KH domain-containing protein akap-1 [Diachasma alloeum]
MAIRNVQLVKWTFPFALIIGLFWYRRRRVDRVDPGGKSEIEKEELKNSQKAQANVKKTSLSDSGINIDDSPSSSPHQKGSSEGPGIGSSPRRVSESLDIPTRRSSSQGISIKSAKSGSSPWYTEVEDIPEMKGIVLGSNPKSSSFDMMSRSKSHLEMTKETEEKVTFSHVPEDEEPKISIDETKTTGQAISERDSANHSPVSGVLDGSVNDEVRSEGSTDSGKGGSINGQLTKRKSTTIYEFAMPQTLVGRMIGKRGISIQQLNAKAEVNIIVKRHPTTKHLKLCVIEGLPENINTALDLIRQRFPLKKYPEVTLEQVNFTNNPEEIPWMTELMQLHLVDGVNNDVMVCHILQPDRLFIQLPTHPTYPSLRLLDYNMTQLYNTVESPPVPDQLAQGMIVVAKWYEKWVRALVEEADPAGEKHLVRLVDHGGFWTFSNAEMRKIRSDYLTLPFQAIEVSLANIKPKNGEWQQEAYDVVAQICSNSIGQAQIEGYIDSSIFISLYINVPKHGVISVAHELIARGLAESVSFEEMLPEQPLTQT